VRRAQLAGLVGKSVQVGLGEPWELRNALGDSVIARILAVPTTKQLLARLNEPTTYQGCTATHLIGSPRYSGDGYLSLIDGGITISNLVACADKPTLRGLSFDYPRSCFVAIGGITLL